ncbi:MAG: hypothetical protein OEW87_04225, partial [Flavobacteriaceae bacterium]|nr:hypothetical protein [Flavobacteriaceae bacterium]
MNKKILFILFVFLTSFVKIYAQDTTAPTLTSITIEDAAPTDVLMVFDEDVTGTNLGFTLAGTSS